MSELIFQHHSSSFTAPKPKVNPLRYSAYEKCDSGVMPQKRYIFFHVLNLESDNLFNKMLLTNNC